MAVTNAAKRNLQTANVERLRPTPCELVECPSLWMLRLRKGQCLRKPGEMRVAAGEARG
jgi:hypothetical protein